MKPIPTPSITAAKPDDAIKQINSYLFQVAQQLNWTLETLEKEISKIKENNP